MEKELEYNKLIWTAFKQLLRASVALGVQRDGSQWLYDMHGEIDAGLKPTNLLWHATLNKLIEAIWLSRAQVIFLWHCGRLHRFVISLCGGLDAAKPLPSLFRAVCWLPLVVELLLKIHSKLGFQSHSASHCQSCSFISARLTARTAPVAPHIIFIRLFNLPFISDLANSFERFKWLFSFLLRRSSRPCAAFFHSRSCINYLESDFFIILSNVLSCVARLCIESWN